MVALWNRADNYIFILFLSFFFFFFFFSSPNLSGRRLDVYHTSGKYRTQKIAISAPSHNFVGPYLSQLRHVSTIGKKNLLSSNTSSTRPDNMVNGICAAVKAIVVKFEGTDLKFKKFEKVQNVISSKKLKLECGPMPNVMAALARRKEEERNKPQSKNIMACPIT